MEDRIFTVVNPVSSNGKTKRLWPEYKKFFLDQGINIDSSYTEKPDHATHLVRKAIDRGYKKIMAVGGDGTINEVVNGFFYQGQAVDSAAKLIIFSQGTGSDYIKSLGISSNIKEVVQIIKADKISFFDLGQITYVTHAGKRDQRYFINIADTGIGAETAYLVNHSSKRLGGFLSYLLGVLRTLMNYDNKVINLSVDGSKILSETINSIIVANGKFFGGGIMIAPEANLRDGRLNIIILRDFGKFEILSNLIKAYQGKHLSHPKVDVVYGKEVSIESDEMVLVEIDGEVLGRLPAKFKILNQKLPVMIS